LAHNLNRNGSSWKPLAKLSVNGTKHVEIWLVCIVSGLLKTQQSVDNAFWELCLDEQEADSDISPLKLPTARKIFKSFLL
jgi:hypothetical protein